MNQVNQVVNKHELIYMQEVVQDVYVEESIYEYITLLVELTRRNPLVNLGVSPRGSLALMNMAKVQPFSLAGIMLSHQMFKGYLRMLWPQDDT